MVKAGAKWDQIDQTHGFHACDAIRSLPVIIMSRPPLSSLHCCQHSYMLSSTMKERMHHLSQNMRYLQQVESMSCEQNMSVTLQFVK